LKLLGVVERRIFSKNPKVKFFQRWLRDRFLGRCFAIGFLSFSDKVCCSLVGLGMELASLNGDKECERRRREEANCSFVRAVLLLF
jgi:hypothetical protein